MNKNGWPDSKRPGIPENPERDGAHEITDNGTHPQHKGPWICLWSAVDRQWCDKWGNIAPPEVMAKHVYVGPYFTPEEVAALTAERDALKEQLDAEFRFKDRHGTTAADMVSHRLAAENAKMREALVEALSVMPVFPKEARQIVGMEAQYNAAREKALELLRHDR
jgi:hypothetical protein